jgi:cobalt/nickel transport system permease protein
MHIPDGFVAPHIYIPSYMVFTLLFAKALKEFKEVFEEKSLPYLATLTAFAFIISSVSLPLPGGTSVHGLGVALLSLLFGPWTAFICISLVLFLQVVLLGEGGISTYAINSLCMGFMGAFSAFFIHRLFKKGSFSLFLSGFASTLLSALMLSILLGIHPYLFKDERGNPLYFPYSFKVVIPALLIPHILTGVGEGLLCLFLYEPLRRRLE